ncbi:MAG: ABC transporter ATP-binding protein [Gemmatimonadales bacterium]
MNVRRLSSEVFPTYLRSLIATARAPLALTLAVSVLTGITEGIGVVLLLPLLQLAGIDSGQGAVRGLTTAVTAAFAKTGLSPTLGHVLAVYVLVNVTQAAIQRSQARSRALVEYRFAHSLRCSLYAALLSARWSYLARIRTARFSHALSLEIDRVGVSTQHFILLGSQTILALIYVGFAMRISTPMTAIALGSGAVLAVLLAYGLSAARRGGEALSNTGGDIHSIVLEHLGSLKKAKTTGSEERNYQAFRSHSERLMGITVRIIGSHAGLTAMSTMGSVIILSVVLYLAVAELHLAGAETLLFIFIFSRLVPRFSSIQQSLQVFLTGLPAYERVLQLTRGAEAAAESHRASVGRIPLKFGLRLDKVFFRYDETLPATIRDLSLEIPAGRTTALVGPSGSGKTTVADLLIGLLRPDEGEILVDERVLTPDEMNSWRAGVGYVAQEAVLFHDTIRANLLWSSPSSSEADLWEALDQAAAAEFVARLPQGLDTQAGDRGIRLSGGERQRIALAQTLLRKPTLLVLDEATSALDPENEQKIRSAVERLHGETTILLITHRLSTVRTADVIHVLEDGQLVETGDWESLMSEQAGRLRMLVAGHH